MTYCFIEATWNGTRRDENNNMIPCIYQRIRTKPGMYDIRIQNRIIVKEYVYDVIYNNGIIILKKSGEKLLSDNPILE